MSPILKNTASRCPVCLSSVPAEVRLHPAGGPEEPESVWLHKSCAEHGSFRVRIATDARYYWLSRGKEENACCAGGACCAAAGGGTGTLGKNAAGRGDGPFEMLSTCLALIEIVDSCNLACPTCFADSPVGAAGAKLAAQPLAGLKERIEGVIARKGGIEILQFSGGEPTLHPQFFELMEWAQTHPQIDYVLVNTNGVRIARDEDFCRSLRAVAARGRVQLYLQYDGPQEAGQTALRGTDLRAMRGEVLRRTGEIGLPLTFAMTVTPDNLPHLWETVQAGLAWPHVRGVSFQPVFHSGRGMSGPPPVRLNAADIIGGAVAQSGGQLRAADFTPLPCGDPNCSIIGYLIRLPDGSTRSVSEFIDFAQVQGFLRDRVRYQLSDLQHCGCESEPLGALLRQFELDESHTFRLFIKPFMDAWTWDEDRIDRCCTHVIRPDGKLDSFCRYYLTA